MKVIVVEALEEVKKIVSYKIPEVLEEKGIEPTRSRSLRAQTEGCFFDFFFSEWLF